MKVRVLGAPVLVLVVVFGLFGRGTPLQAQSSGVALTVTAGWNLIAGQGSALRSDVQVGPTIDTLQPGDMTYETLPSSGVLQSGRGYWVYFNEGGAFSLPAGNNGPIQLAIPAGQYVMVGDPSGTEPATVSGADAVYTYSAIGGYTFTGTLQPGQGAWVASRAGGVVTITPNAAAVNVTISPSGNNLETVTTRNGYQFQIPSGWMQLQAQPGQTIVKGELVFASPSGNRLLEVDSFTGRAIPSDPSMATLQALQGGLNFATGALMNNSIMAAISTPVHNVTLNNGDIGAVGTVTVTGVNGVGGMATLEVGDVLHGSTIYLFVLVDLSGGDNSALLLQIMNSLQVPA